MHAFQRWNKLVKFANFSNNFSYSSSLFLLRQFSLSVVMISEEATVVLSEKVFSVNNIIFQILIATLPWRHVAAHVET